MKFSLYTPFARYLSYIILIVVAAFMLAPLIWMTYSVFKPTGDIFRQPFALPVSFDLSNIVDAWQFAQFGSSYINSVIVTTISVLGILVFEGAAAYAFARLNFPGKRILFIVFLVGQMVPAQMVVLPSFIQMSFLNLNDTLLSLIFQYWSWAPFAVLFLRASFLAVPKDIEDAARIDGAGRMTILWQVVLPMTRSAFATIAVVYSLWIWNDFLFPLVYLRSADNYTVPLGLAMFQGTYTTYWGELLGAICIAIWPPLIVYLLLSRPIQSSMATGSMKF
ncbi:sugar ABC transporter permease [Dictyobacter alpinus]|uniref:Sugar ABC transporter permease n=1 Tax=Dictyobacter alpinus TaxID=2014873 RepID=A0A402BE66_9CHLR|nr:carbohydrate ABC transporter permease [Dictyobacter alpinus]GCE29547.1 sugar ABC transporter permease [Dictyobacter alpinus]